MKSLVHKGEIGLVLTKAEAGILWRMFYNNDAARAAWEEGAKEKPVYVPEPYEDEFNAFETSLWYNLNNLLCSIHRGET